MNLGKYVEYQVSPHDLVSSLKKPHAPVESVPQLNFTKQGITNQYEAY